MTIGPRLGVNFSKQALNSPYEVWNTGTLFGGVINTPFKNDISFQGEFLFSQKGYREEFNGNESFDDLTSTYMEAPIPVNYLYSTGRINFFGNGGVFDNHLQIQCCVLKPDVPSGRDHNVREFHIFL